MDLRTKYMNQTQEKLKQSLKKDQLIVQAIENVKELERASNFMAEKCREWYGLYFPECGKILKENKEFLKFVAFSKSREDTENRQILDAAKSTIGSEIEGDDLKAIQSFSISSLELLKIKENIENYLEKEVKTTAPNLNELIGWKITAELISIAGNIEKLAHFPSGTIQVLGAEDSFFRFLQTKKLPPKHGVIFEHPVINSAPRKIRGKIARVLAGKISIAAKVDFYKGDFIGNKLKKDLNKRVEYLMQQPSKPRTA